MSAGFGVRYKLGKFFCFFSYKSEQAFQFLVIYYKLGIPPLLHQGLKMKTNFP